MKMENPVLAPFDAQIVEICVRLNQMVEEGQLLFVLNPLENNANIENTGESNIEKLPH
jgi:pyruvate carboxylase